MPDKEGRARLGDQELRQGEPVSSKCEAQSNRGTKAQSEGAAYSREHFINSQFGAAGQGCIF